MQKTIFIITLAISVIASAADFSRCGQDQFGNTVCVDKDGVLTTISKPSAEDSNGVAASGVSAAEAKARRDEINGKLRCGIDPFGNKVCR